MIQTGNIKQLCKLYDKKLCRERFQEHVTMIALQNLEIFNNIFEYERIQNSNNVKMILRLILSLCEIEVSNIHANLTLDFSEDSKSYI